jgi:multiple sugar transport system substrate-binding protein
MALSRRTVLAAGLGAAGAAAAAARGRAQGALALNVLYTDPQLLKDIHEEIARRFMAQHPGVRINLSVVANYDEALARLLRAAITGDLPDVGFLGHNHLGLLGRRGLLVALDPLIEAERDWEAQGYSEPLKAIGRADGRVYGLPFALSTLICMYNEPLVRAAGGDPRAFPQDWSGVVALGRRISVPSGGIYFRYESAGNVFLYELLCACGARIMSEDRRTVLLDSPEGLRALEVLRDIGEARGGSDMGGAQARQAFASGTLGVLVDGSSGLTSYQRQADGRFAIGAAPIPVAAGVAARIPSAGNSGAILTRLPAKQRAAWDYLKFATNPESQTLLAMRSSFSPVNSVAINRPDLLGDYYRERPSLRTALAQFPILTGWEAFPGPNALRIEREIQEEVQAVLTLRKPPADALASMAQIARTLMVTDG